MVLVLLVLAGAIYYFATPMERERMAGAAVGRLRQLKPIADDRRHVPGAFGDLLRARTPRLVVTPLIVAVHLVVVLGMLVAPGRFGEPETVMRWGGSWGPLTTNGEWWRLVTELVVHDSMLQAAVNTLALAQTGIILERLFGRAAFAAVFLGAGALGSVIGLALDPVSVTAGSTGAVLAIHGLLMAAVLAGTLLPSPITIPLTTLVRLGPVSGLFLAYSVLAGRIGWPELAAVTVGFVYGLAIGRGVAERSSSSLRVAASATVFCLVTFICAAPLRGVANVKPEIERVVVVEQTIASAYDAAVHRFQNGQLTAAGLADAIDRSVLPELTSAHARLKKLEGVPRQHQPLVDGAEEYFKLRESSWLIRAEGLRKNKTPKLREAEQVERAALDALEKIKPIEKDKNEAAPAAVTEQAPAAPAKAAPKKR